MRYNYDKFIRINNNCTDWNLLNKGIIGDLTMNKNINKIWDLLIEYGIATQEELQLVTCINGYNIDTMNDIIYARTAHRDIEQLMEEV